MIEKSTMFSLIHQSDDKWRLIRFALMDESVRGHDYIFQTYKDDGSPPKLRMDTLIILKPRSRST